MSLPGILERDWVRYLTLALTGFLVRMPALSGRFIWDDGYLARDNPFIKSPLLIFEAFRHHLFLDSLSSHYRPVQNLSYILDYYFWNTNPYGFHLTNVLLHVASGLLLYALLRKLLNPFLSSSGASLSAFFVALLWLVHPVHSAAVDYISGRADSLAFLFCAAGWLLVLRAEGCEKMIPRLTVYGAAGLCALLGLCSRESAILWITLFLIHLFVFEKRLSRVFKWKSLICCIAVLAMYACLHALPGKRPTPSQSQGWTPLVRSVLMLRALGDYGRLMVFPSNLHMERTVVDPANYGSAESWRDSIRDEYLSVGGLLVLAVFAAGSLRKGPGQKTRIFGATWFLIAYLPTSNIVDLNATVAEHWLYLSSVGFLLFLAGCAYDLPQHRRKLTVAFVGLAVVGLSVRSFVRSSDWETPEIFFKRTMAAGGGSARIAVNLGQVYANRKDYKRAEAIFRKILQETPDYPIAINDLANVLNLEGRSDEAKKIFAAASAAAPEERKDYPLTWIAALNLSRLRFNEGNRSDALAILEKARREYPGIWEVICFEAELRRQKGEPDAALRLVTEFSATHWWHYEAALALGHLYAEKGNLDEAKRVLLHASRLDVHDAKALNLLATVELRQNRIEAACETQRRAVARQPDEPRQYILLSDILEKMGRKEEARKAIAGATRLRYLATSVALPD